MSTVFMSFILTGGIIVIVFILRLINNKNIRKRKDKLSLLLSHAGTKHGLSFSSQELLRNKIVGLDGIQRRFVIVNEKEETTVVALDDVKNCNVKKVFENLQFGSSKNKEFERRLASIELVFEFKNNNQPVSVMFFNHLVHPVIDAASMEAKAKDWEIVLSKMLTLPAKARA